MYIIHSSLFHISPSANYVQRFARLAVSSSILSLRSFARRVFFSAISVLPLSHDVRGRPGFSPRQRLVVHAAHAGIPRPVREHVAIEREFDSVLVDDAQRAGLGAGCLHDRVEGRLVSRRAVHLVGLSDAVGPRRDLELGLHVVLRRSDVHLDALDVRVEVVVLDHPAALHHVAGGGVGSGGDRVVGRDHPGVVGSHVEGHLLRAGVVHADGLGVLRRFDDAVHRPDLGVLGVGRDLEGDVRGGVPVFDARVQGPSADSLGADLNSLRVHVGKVEGPQGVALDAAGVGGPGEKLVVDGTRATRRLGGLRWRNGCPPGAELAPVIGIEVERVQRAATARRSCGGQRGGCKGRCGCRQGGH
mmetsp:Transcript_10135/g.24596  ORF Transcript_10135/g.24596 Transcript_10135/m.24596 type:complete len:359 (-) Transcript_10135:148-1224(-)